MENDMITHSRTLIPKEGKNLLVMIDDINLPLKDKYGIQSFGQIIRQWFDHGGWYNTNPVHFKQIEKVCYYANVSVKETT